jgi:catechol 2,3-dioxygenase-like lactoylglutathione lyase family enzyme
VSNLERSIDFYCNLVGMKLIGTQVHDQPYTSVQVGFPNTVLKAARLTIEGIAPVRSGHLLELIEYVNPRGEPTDTTTNRPGAAHLAFQVDDLPAAYQRMKSQGVRFKSEPVKIMAGPNEGGWTIYFLDPDDITLEMVQPRPLP